MRSFTDLSIFALILNSNKEYKKTNLMIRRCIELDIDLPMLVKMIREDPGYIETQIPSLKGYCHQVQPDLDSTLQATTLILEWCDEYRIQILTEVNDTIPTRILHDMPLTHPPVLFCWGNDALVESPSVGIIGARRASAKGKQIAKEMAQTLSNEGYAIVSGFAYGIDQYAHLGAIQGETGSIFVLSMPLDQFPSQGVAELMEHSEKVLLISQFPPFIPTEKNAPMVRNQTITALSNQLVVLEAGTKSGTIATARGCIRKHKPLFVAAFPESESPDGNRELLNGGIAQPLPVHGDGVDLAKSLLKKLQSHPKRCMKKQWLNSFNGNW
jgi:DNA protecting protein DprA